MRITQTFDVRAPAEKVWDILGPNCALAGDWASGVHASAPRAGTTRVAGARLVPAFRHTSAIATPPSARFRMNRRSAKRTPSVRP